MSEVRALARALKPVAEQATTLPWHKERAWTPRSHVWDEKGLAMVDLHDLSIRLGVDAVERAADLMGEDGLPAVCFITGVGRHSVDGRSRLREAVTEEVRRIADEEGWDWRVPSQGRVVLIADGERAPGRATGKLGFWFWMGVAAFLGLTLYVSPPLGLVFLILILAFSLMP